MSFLPLLSKTRYIQGLQCPKLLWHVYNARDAIPPVSDGTQAIFDQGHEVGLLAQSLFAGGITIEGITPFEEIAVRSEELISRRVPLFEAGFQHGRVIARADVLEPVGRNEWDIVEMKSSTSVSDPYWDDLAIQRHCYEGAGLRIRRCAVMHIDNTYTREGPMDPTRLFVRVDVTEEVEKKREGIERRVEEMLKVIDAARSPEVEIGPQCGAPYPCPLVPVCWKKVLETKRSIFSLTRLGGKAWPLYRQGVETTGTIPASFRLSAVQKIQVQAEKSNTPHIDSLAVAKFLATLEYPLHYLDFETLQAAIPLLDGTRPYQQVPFQFSLHIVAAPDGGRAHHSWIWDGQGDPRRILVDELQKIIGPRGSIVAYNAAFETARLKECAVAYPEAATWVDGILERTVDLYTPFRTFSVYFPAQAGSASMKSVLPALTGKGYKDLAIHEGTEASLEFKRITFGDVSEEERRRIRSQLEEYCGLDTSGMVEIVGKLGQLITKPGL
jgi:hypothetical protein